MADIEAPPKMMAKAAAAAAAALHGILSLAADVVIFGFLATLWLSNAAIAVRWACGENSCADPPSRGCSPWPPPSPWGCFSSPLSCCSSGTARAATQWPERLVGMKKAPGGRRCRVLRILEDAAVRITTPIVAFFLVLIAVGVLMEELAPGKGSCAGRIGSMLTDIGCFLTSVLFCFVIFPNFLINLRPQCTKVNSS